MLALTAACARDSAETTSSPAAEVAPTDVGETPSTTLAPTDREAFLAASGVLFLHCEERDESTTLNFRVLDPTSGAVSTHFTAEVVAPSTDVLLKIPACGSDRALLPAPHPNPGATSDWSKVVVMMKGFADDSEHVGYFDVNLNQLVDLTAGLPQADFADAPVHTDPFFATDGLLRYSNEGQLFEINLSSPTSTNSVPPRHSVGALWFDRERGGPVVAGEVGEHLLAEGGALVPLGWFLSPSGTQVAGECKGQTVSSNNGICVLKTANNTWVHTPINHQYESLAFDPIPMRVVAPDHGFVAIGGFVTQCAAPMGWLDEERILTVKLEVLTAKANGTCNPLLPNTDRANFSPILSRDRTTILFQSQQGDITSLFTTSVAPPSPRRITDLSQVPTVTPPLTGTVVAWNS